MFKKKEQLNIGIDIGSAFIKAVAIDRSKATPELVAFSHEPIAEDKVVALKKIISNLELSNTSVATSVSGPSTVARIVEMPKMNDKELKGAIKFEAEKYMPYKLDDVITDCVKIEDLPNGKISILLIAAKKSIIENRIALLSEAGLTPRIIDIDSFAIMNAFLNSQGTQGEDTPCALIDIGAKTTNINIIKDEQSYLVRDIQLSGKDVTEAMAEKLNLKFHEAEALKINPGERKNEVTTIVKNIFYNLVNEIKLSFDFYESRYGKNVAKVYISGGSANLEALLPFFQEIFAINAVIWDPFNNINMGTKIDQAAFNAKGASFAVAVGLGLREG